jgi:ligand-binding SRPBCC domain-containing protein
MKVFELRRTQVVKRPLEEVFSFFQDPSNLARITPPELGFQILTPAPIPMGKGALIDYTVRVAGWPLRWTSLISEYDPPRRFVDVQVKGPYSFWHHAHLFAAHPEGTLIEDVIHYALPFGPFGRWAEPLMVRRQLRAIFDYRSQVIGKLFAS